MQRERERRLRKNYLTDHHSKLARTRITLRICVRSMIKQIPQKLFYRRDNSRLLRERRSANWDASEHGVRVVDCRASSRELMVDPVVFFCLSVRAYCVRNAWNFCASRLEVNARVQSPRHDDVNLESLCVVDARRQSRTRAWRERNGTSRRVASR